VLLLLLLLLPLLLLPLLLLPLLLLLQVVAVVMSLPMWAMWALACSQQQWLVRCLPHPPHLQCWRPFGQSQAQGAACSSSKTTQVRPAAAAALVGVHAPWSINQPSITDPPASATDACRSSKQQ
jgi:hypothetical protein